MEDGQANELVSILKALADLSRLKILGLLSQREMNVGAIAAELSLTEPTISHHLARLASIDFVTMRPDGTSRLYRLNEARFREFQRAFGAQPATVAGEDSNADGGRASKTNLTDDEKVLRNFVKDGRLVKIPETMKKRRVILQWLVDRLDVAKKYPEKELNGFLKQYHDDFATLRRELVDGGFMARRESVYWRL